MAQEDEVLQAVQASAPEVSGRVLPLQCTSQQGACRSETESPGGGREPSLQTCPYVCAALRVAAARKKPTDPPNWNSLLTGASGWRNRQDTATRRCWSWCTPRTHLPSHLLPLRCFEGGAWEVWEGQGPQLLQGILKRPLRLQRGDGGWVSGLASCMARKPSRRRRRRSSSSAACQACCDRAPCRRIIALARSRARMGMGSRQLPGTQVPGAAPHSPNSM